MGAAFGLRLFEPTRCDVAEYPAISKVSCMMYWANARKRILTRRVNDFLACSRKESVRGMGEAMAIVYSEVRWN